MGKGLDIEDSDAFFSVRWVSYLESRDRTLPHQGLQQILKPSSPRGRGISPQLRIPRFLYLAESFVDFPQRAPRPTPVQTKLNGLLETVNRLVVFANAKVSGAEVQIGLIHTDQSCRDL
jgi:hypothetical protein